MSKAVDNGMRRLHMRINELKPLELPSAQKQFIARKVRQDYGIEITPDEAEQSLKDSLSHIRRHMVANGHHEFATMDDAEVRLALRDAYR